jgi:MFS family permease
MVSFIFLAIVFCSGFAALLYQTIWQRLLTLVLGTDVRAATIVICAFMAGLGAGNLVGGSLADRLTVPRRLVAFAACELGVAVFALASAAIYYDVLYSGRRTRGTLHPAMGRCLRSLGLHRTVARDRVVPHRWRGSETTSVQLRMAAVLLPGGRGPGVARCWPTICIRSSHFSLLRDHLQPNGLAVTWAPTGRVLDGMLAVFPHAVRFESIVVASESPVALDVRRSTSGSGKPPVITPPAASTSAR